MQQWNIGQIGWSKIAHWIGLPILASLYPAIVALNKGVVLDDPFILMRYAEHVAHGQGWTFNLGFPTNNAITSPLFALLLATGILIGGSALTWAVWLYVAAWGLGGVVLARILFLDGRRLGGWLACGFYSCTPMLANVVGMETTLYLLLIMTAILLYQGERWLLLGCALALATLAREDGLLLAGALVFWLFVGRRIRIAMWVLAPIALCRMVWMGWLWWMTGSPLPTTLSAKVAQRDSGQWGSQLNWLRGIGTNGLMGSVGDSGLLVLTAAVLLTAATLGTVIAVRGRERAVPLLAAAATIVVVEYGIALRLSPDYLWHYGPLTLWVTAAASIAFDESARRGDRIATPLAVGFAAAGLLSAVQLGPDAIRGHVPEVAQWLEFRSHYKQAAQWIDHDSTKPHPTVAAMEIGTPGYYSRADMVDYLGLLDSRSHDAIRHGNFAWWLTQKPDYWITSGGSIDAATLTAPEFRTEYKLAAAFGSLKIYRHIDAGAAPAG